MSNSNVWKSLVRVSRMGRNLPRRGGDHGGELPAKWSKDVRRLNNCDNPDDFPTSPLPEQHEIGEGGTTSDFGNWIDRHEDVGVFQMFGGLGLACFGIWGVLEYSKVFSARQEPAYVPRELPYYYLDRYGLPENMGGNPELVKKYMSVEIPKEDH